MSSFVARACLLAVVLAGLWGCSSGSGGSPGGGCHPTTRAAGESCNWCDTCKSTASGIGYCSNGGADTPGVCVVLGFGQDGDGPCVATFGHGTARLATPDGGVPDNAVVCGLGQGCAATDLYCSSGTGKCAKRNALGATCDSCSYSAECPGAGPCAAGGYCDGSGTCAAVKQVGDSCQDHPECGANYCSSSMVCTAYLQPGAKCSDQDQCTVACVNGTCAKASADACASVSWQ